MDLSLIQAHSVAAEKVADGLTELETYIGNNQEFIPNFGERRRQGETVLVQISKKGGARIRLP